MKIKQKKQFTLPQLIEWAWDNGVENKECPCVGFESKTVIFNGIGWAEFSDEFSYNPHDTFTVEVEEEIDEDTVLPRILVKTNYDDTAKEYNNSMINEFVPIYTKAIYILNDDLTMTLIWRDGKLVE